MRSETFIYYNQKFWLGVFTEEDSSGKIVRVGRYIFGKEPSLAELDEWMAKGFPGLVLNPVCQEKEVLKEIPLERKNPKRALREVRKLAKKESSFEESRSHKAMREFLEEHKKESKKRRREEKRKFLQESYERKQAQKKKKKKGH